MDPLLTAFAMVSVLVLAGSLIPRARLPAWLPNDKLLHVLCYAVGAGLLSLRFSPDSGLAMFLAAWFAGGVAIEWLQRFVPGRGFCAKDVVANGAGLLLGAGVALMWIWGGG